MGIYRQYGAKDEQDEPVGDIGFLGMDDRQDPRRMAQGLVALAVNKDFADGSAATRLGWSTTSWGGGLGVSFDPNFDGTEEGFSFDPDLDTTEEGFDFETCGFGEIFGHLVFSDPNGNESLLVATRNGVWRVRNYAEAELIRLPLREKITYPVRMIQCFDVVLMLRGVDLTVLKWNPQQSVVDGIGEFVEIVQTSTGDYTEEIPNTEYGFSFANRAFLQLGRDQLAASDILDYTRWNSVFNTLRVNAGTDDAIMACVGSADNRVLVLKRRSAYTLDGLFGTDIGFTVTVNKVTSERGLIGRDAVVDMGGGEWAYLSDGGVYVIGMTEENKLRSSPAPLSWPLPKLFARVHWPFASGAILAVHAERLYCALPIDGSQSNNSLMVYNLTTKKWEGYWTADYLKIVGLPIVTEHGEKRLCILNGTGTVFDAMWVAEVDGELDYANIGAPLTVAGPADGALLVTGEGYADFIYGHTAWIKDEIVTRGYGLQTLQQVDQLRATLDQATWNPRFSVSVRRGGNDSETVVADDTRRGFELDSMVEVMSLKYPRDAAAITAGQRVFNGFTISGDIPDWLTDTGAGWGYISYPGITGIPAALKIVGPEYSDLKIPFGVRWVGHVYVFVSPPTASDIYLKLTGDTGLTTTFDIPTMLPPPMSPAEDVTSWTDFDVVRMPTVGRTFTFEFVANNTLVSILAVWTELTIYAQFDTRHSRKQSIYGADEVLWQSGSNPPVIEAKGYDDYAWRLGTGILPGVTLGQMQRQTEVYRIRKRGEFVQVRTVCERGRHVLHGVQLDGQVGRRGLRRRIG